MQHFFAKIQIRLDRQISNRLVHEETTLLNVVIVVADVFRT